LSLQLHFYLAILAKITLSACLKAHTIIINKRGNLPLVDWPSILEACAENMKKQVRPLFGSTEAQRGYGRGAGGDVKKKIDLAAETALVRTLHNRKASCTLISEESGISQIGKSSSQFYLTVDPVDGTANAVRGLPFAAVSLAVSKTPLLSKVEVGLVADVLRDVTYTAERGRGAHKNGNLIKPSNTERLEDAMIGLDLGTFKARRLVDQLAHVLVRAKHLRHLGANALEICYVADGTSDAFIDIRGKLRVTDTAAAYLILREAGGTTRTPSGADLDASLDPQQRVSFIAAANESMYKTISQLLGSS
jgi:myo-inositol-1(or 4)-monophosphatase